MADNQISGKVIDRNPKHELAGLRIEAYDKSWPSNEPLDKTNPNNEGDFLISIDRLVRKGYGEWHPRIYFKVKRDDQIIKETEVLWDEIRDQKKTIQIDISGSEEHGMQAKKTDVEKNAGFDVAVNKEKKYTWKYSKGEIFKTLADTNFGTSISLLAPELRGDGGNGGGGGDGGGGGPQTPILSIKITSPDTAYVSIPNSGILSVTCSVENKDSVKIKKVEIQTGRNNQFGNIQVAEYIGGEYICQYADSDIRLGRGFQIKATVIGDIGGRTIESTDEIKVTIIDKIPPDLSIISPKMGDSINGAGNDDTNVTEVPVSVNAGDYFGLKSIKLSVFWLQKEEIIYENNDLGEVKTWNKIIPFKISPTPITRPGINIICTDKSGNTTERRLYIDIIDVHPPKMTIIEPTGEVQGAWHGYLEVEVKDLESGVDKTSVKYALDPTDPKDESKFTPLKESTDEKDIWYSPDMLDLTIGNHIIYICAKDNEGNPIDEKDDHESVNVTPLPYLSNDTKGILSYGAYLYDLLWFARNRIDTKVDNQLLEMVLYQPFDRLIDTINEQQGNQQVSHVRICIEVLRQYLADNKIQITDSEEKKYLLDAYKTLLTKIGTSYDEIRLARTAVTEKRRALADRLGIDLGDRRPDELDKLLLDPLAITEQTLEGIFGLVDTTSDPLSGKAVSNSDLLSWRLKHLRTLWMMEDWPEDPYSKDLLPIIDPDIIGPDDFRHPIKGEPAFDLWEARREWADTNLGKLKADREKNGLDYILPVLGKSASDLEELLSKLVQGVDLDNTRNEIKKLHLTIDSFTHLMAIRNKDKLAEKDLRNEIVNEEEWEEVYSILAQAQKVASFELWVIEEIGDPRNPRKKGKGILLSPKLFWISQREPKEGSWPPVHSLNLPFIDPEALKLDELPEPTAGKRAIELWKIRRESLENIKKALETARENGTDEMLKLALGHPDPGNPLQYDLVKLNDDLKSTNQQVKQEAEKKITEDLHMTVEDFTVLLDVIARDGKDDPSKKPTAEEWIKVYTILTSARKEKHEFPKWLLEEHDMTTGVDYWNALKARLPRWRASSEARRDWQEALLIRSGEPIIDPDLIKQEDLKDFTKGTPASTLWNKRRIWVGQLWNIYANSGVQPAILEKNVKTAIGVDLSDLAALESESEQGMNIIPRLEQLSLTYGALSYLLRIHEILASGIQILDSEWWEACSILIQVVKRRKFAEWRLEEKKQNIILSSDYFNVPEQFIDESLYLEAWLPEVLAWRITWDDWSKWGDTLQSRIDQEQSIKQTFWESILSVEEVNLPALRDALVKTFAKSKNINVSDASDRLTKRLLIDVKEDGSLQTTRILQAIETLQGIFFSFQIDGKFEIDGISWNKNNSDAKFDEEWKWMGSYSLWRAAMLNFLYPENILLPSLRDKVRDKDKQTAEFKVWLNGDPNDPKNIGVRNIQHLTPTVARQKAQDFFAKVKPKDYPIDPITEEDLTDEKLSKLITWNNDHVKGSLDEHLKEVSYFVPIQLALQLQKSGEYNAALGWFQLVYAYKLTVEDPKIYYGLREEGNNNPLALSALSRDVTWFQLNPHELAEIRNHIFNPYTRYTLMSIVRCLLEFADTEFAHDTSESIAKARALYITADGLLSLDDLKRPSPNDNTHLSYPVLDSLNLHVETQLLKLRQGRNIAGMKRHVEVTSENNLPAINISGQLVLPENVFTQSTPYRYRILIERSKQLVSIAQQMESAYLSFLEKTDAESYSLLKAQQDLALASAGVELQNRRKFEADDSVGLAKLQKERAQIQVDHYNELLKHPINKHEQASLDLYEDAAYMQYGAALSSGGLAVIAGLIAGGVIGNAPGAGAGAVVAAVLPGASSGLSSWAAGLSTEASVQATLASYERREDDWRNQMALSQKDVLIGQKQQDIASDNVLVVKQEQKIAGIQKENADAIVNFLGNKFTNVELYEWMSGVLAGVYSYFLQQATAMTRLAQSQLAFERQEMPVNFIQSDYWQPVSDTVSTGSTDSNTKDRRGLTGSARLLEDIYQLDQYAFETDKRKLNLTHTFSMAQLDPFGFQQFRETGVLQFATPMKLFDQGFPGHYLRLIKRVRTSVVALIPPTQGIRATLIASGISRVVVGGDVFQNVVVRRDPESVALSSPVNATGVFELDQQSDMLMPFESMGVDTSWEFQMPKAANPFDYSTIADVLVTIEYTALNSLDYRQQVIKTLDPKISGDRSFSFRNQFADQWYSLHNPDQADNPMVVKFDTEREDFPPNIEGLKIEQVLLYFSRKDGQSFEVQVTDLCFTEQSNGQSIGGAATSIDGVISTRRGNGYNWISMKGNAPVEKWELTLPNTDEMKKRFTDEDIEDILFVITFSGRTPEWPV
jgi:hypothetical protein